LRCCAAHQVREPMSIEALAIGHVRR